MSNYKFSLYNYHAVAEANIELNGITVLSGPNGSGKSTIARWIYYLINAINMFDGYEVKEYINSLRVILEGLSKLRISSDSQHSLDDAMASLYRIEADDEEAIADARSIYLSQISNFCDDFVQYLSNSGERKSTRAINFLYEILGDEDTFVIQSLDPDYYRQLFVSAEDVLFKKYQNNVEKHPFLRLKPFIKRYYDEKNSAPERMQLFEDDVRILKKDESFENLLGLKRAIYVDTPMSINSSFSFSTNQHWLDLQYLLLQPNKDFEPTQSQKKINKRIQQILHGTIEARKEIKSRIKLHYLREDGLDIEVSQIATGMKSFAYLLQLLNNGWLDKNTLMIIDEPEAHEHPQWIFEFARLLVLLNKEIGVKFLLASHNPDMVSALQSIAKRESVIDSLVFYQASSLDELSFSYSFEHLGTDITKIFQSFNIAIDRIHQYGE